MISQDKDHRIYYIDGRHRSTLFPTMRAQTAVFTRLIPTTVAHGRSGVQTSLVSYTRFEDSLLSRLMHLFRALVTRPVNRTLAKEFSLTHRLGMLIAEDPQADLPQTEGLSDAGADDRQTLLALIRSEIFSSTQANPTP